MSKVVTCTNDKNLPEGAHVVEDKEYIVEKEFLNNYGQKVYLLVGTTNTGMTTKGMKWHGYDATRFTTNVAGEVKHKEYEFALN